MYSLTSAILLLGSYIFSYTFACSGLFLSIEFNRKKNSFSDLVHDESCVILVLKNVLSTCLSDIVLIVHIVFVSLILW